MPEGRYQCTRCSRHFRQPVTDRTVWCPYCGDKSLYLRWLNYREVVAWLMENDEEYRRSYEQPS